MYKIFRLELEQPCYHVTLCANNGRSSFVHSSLSKNFIEHILFLKEKSIFYLFSFVVLHDHCHLILSPIQPNNINDSIKIIKSYSPSGEGSFSFWDKSRFFSEIKNDDEFKDSLDKDFFDPLKLGFASFREKYPFSSANLDYRYKVDLAMTSYFPSFIVGSLKRSAIYPILKTKKKAS